MSLENVGSERVRHKGRHRAAKSNAAVLTRQVFLANPALREIAAKRFPDLDENVWWLQDLSSRLGMHEPPPITEGFERIEKSIGKLDSCIADAAGFLERAARTSLSGNLRRPVTNGATVDYEIRSRISFNFFERLLKTDGLLRAIEQLRESTALHSNECGRLEAELHRQISAVISASWAARKDVQSKMKSSSD